MVGDFGEGGAGSAAETDTDSGGGETGHIGQ
jgi:hypothetical protein